MVVKILRNTVAGRRSVKQGDVIELEDQEARWLIGAKRAEEIPEEVQEVPEVEQEDDDTEKGDEEQTDSAPKPKSRKKHHSAGGST